MEKRFEKISEESVGGNIYAQVLRDRTTGVLYLCTNWGSGTGLTVLVDKDGKPLTSYQVSI